MRLFSQHTKTKTNPLSWLLILSDCIPQIFMHMIIKSQYRFLDCFNCITFIILFLKHFRYSFVSFNLLGCLCIIAFSWTASTSFLFSIIIWIHSLILNFLIICILRIDFARIRIHFNICNIDLCLSTQSLLFVTISFIRGRGYLKFASIKPSLC